MKMKKFLILIMLAALAFAACDNTVVDPRDSGYEFRTAEKYRNIVAVIPGGVVRTVSGEDEDGVFTEDKMLTGYSIAKYETTWELWSEVYDWALGHGYSITNKGTEGHGTDEGTGGPNWGAASRRARPVTGITWMDVVIWCNAYSELSRLEAVYYTEAGGALRAPPGGDGVVIAQVDKTGFRLPLETEWEYAARGGSTNETTAWNYSYSGGSAPGPVAWYKINAESVGVNDVFYGAHQVGTMKSNRLELFDMSGNAAEWCWDSYTYDMQDAQRVVRGGSWKSEASACAVKARVFRDPGEFDNGLGFRVARTVPDDGDEGPPEDEEEQIETLPAFTGLAGTKWLWGQSLLEFAESTVTFRGTGPQYTYTVTSMTEGQEGTGTIETQGHFNGKFTVNAERTTLEIIDYRNGGTAIDNRGKFESKVYNAVFTRRDPAVLTPEYLEKLSTSTLMGTEWNIPVGGGTDGTRGKGTQWIIFFTKTVSVNRSANYTNIDEYTFNKNSMKGWIYFINNFILQDWDNMYIPVYKQYGHDMRCYRVR
jgi:formylglycine-generating enzyme required for sulfatase activity